MENFKPTYRGVNMFAIKFKHDGVECWAVVEGVDERGDPRILRWGVVDSLPDGWQARASRAQRCGVMTVDNAATASMSHRGTAR